VCRGIGAAHGIRRQMTRADRQSESGFAGFLVPVAAALIPEQHCGEPVARQQEGITSPGTVRTDPAPVSTPTSRNGPRRP
jgi:hypothetical protein